MISRENLTLTACADAIRTDDKQAAATGAKLADLLMLRRDKAHRDRWQTAWGSKTDTGLARSVLAALESSRIETAKDREPFTPAPDSLAAHLFDLGCAMNRARAKELDPAREV